MGTFKVYLTPFDDEGNYDEEIDITKYVDLTGIGDVTVSLDGSEYQIGVFNNSAITLKVNNREGKFSDVDTFQSFFRYRRTLSIVRITWQQGEDPICGVAICGEAILADEVDVFKGVIADESFSTDIKNQASSFKVMGLESVFQKAIVPFDTVDSGDPISETLYEILNQPEITALLTVLQPNISPGLNQNIDSLASIQNKTVKEGLDGLLVCSNSVLYIRNDIVYVSDREPTAEVIARFYGQASRLGAENILDIKDLKNGSSRVVNFATWAGTTNARTDAESVTRHGVKKKELSYEYFNNSTKINNILDSVIDEFGTAMQEFDMVVPLNYDTLALQLLDKVEIDYPTVYIQGETDLPICGVANWGEFVLSDAAWSLTISPDEPYKVITKKIGVRTQTITYRMRKI